MQVELHAQERPIALQTSMTANMNRDAKKQRKPYGIEEFYLYQPKDEQNLPEGRCAAAAVELYKRKMFPGWAMFCYKELATSAIGAPPPLLAFMSPKALLLAPIKTEHGYKGMLVAGEEVSEKWQTFMSPCGKMVTMYVPEIKTKFIAQDNVTLRRK